MEAFAPQQRIRTVSGAIVDFNPRSPTASQKDPAMSKQQMIDQIVHINHSAMHEFLESFAEPELDSYLRRLTQVRNHRGRESRWVREGDTHAVVTQHA